MVVQWQQLWDNYHEPSVAADVRTRYNATQRNARPDTASNGATAKTSSADALQTAQGAGEPEAKQSEAWEKMLPPPENVIGSKPGLLESLGMLHPLEHARALRRTCMPDSEHQAEEAAVEESVERRVAEADAQAKAERRKAAIAEKAAIAGQAEEDRQLSPNQGAKPAQGATQGSPVPPAGPIDEASGMPGRAGQVGMVATEDVVAFRRIRFRRHPESAFQGGPSQAAFAAVPQVRVSSMSGARLSQARGQAGKSVGRGATRQVNKKDSREHSVDESDESMCDGCVPGTESVEEHGRGSKDSIDSDEDSDYSGKDATEEDIDADEEGHHRSARHTRTTERVHSGVPAISVSSESDGGTPGRSEQPSGRDGGLDDNDSDEDGSIEDEEPAIGNSSLSAPCARITAQAAPTRRGRGKPQRPIVARFRGAGTSSAGAASVSDFADTNADGSDCKECSSGVPRRAFFSSCASRHGLLKSRSEPIRGLDE